MGAVIFRGRRELVGLDVLRGLAIALVIVAHFFYPFIGTTALKVMSNGGVTLFFFLSGFLMDRSFALEPKLTPYIVRRSFRILPMYWISIALIFFVGNDWTIFDVTANAIFIAPAVHAPRMSGVYWTLYIEVLFYALVPVIWNLGNRAILLAPYLLITIYVACWLVGITISAAPFYLVYCFAGMQIGAWTRNAVSSPRLAASITTIVVASSVLPIVAPWLGLVPLACASLLWIALRYKARLALFELFAAVSYSWYLLHVTVGFPVIAATQSFGHWQSVCLGVAASFVASIVTFLLVEEPLIRIGKLLVEKYRYSFAVASPAE